MIVSVDKWGNSLAVRLPKAIAEQAGIAKGQQVRVRASRGGILISPVEPRRYDLRELVRGITDENRHAATETGDPVGREVW
jgi:antitoxin MazE